MKSRLFLINAASVAALTALLLDVETWRALLIYAVLAVLHCTGYTAGIYKRFDK